MIQSHAHLKAKHSSWYRSIHSETHALGMVPTSRQLLQCIACVRGQVTTSVMRTHPRSSWPCCDREKIFGQDDLVQTFLSQTCNCAVARSSAPTHLAFVGPTSSSPCDAVDVQQQTAPNYLTAARERETVVPGRDYRVNSI